MHDVIVVGSGPGGSTAATYLARSGLRVLLLDKAKFPRDKTCGDAVSGKSMKVMRELDLVKEIERRPHGRIDGVLFSSPDGHVADIPFKPNDPNREGGRGYCMRRMHTDEMLFRKAQSTPGVETREGVSVNEVILEHGFAVGVRGIDTTQASRPAVEFRAKAVVGADGVNSVVARSVLGAEAQLKPQHSCDAVRQYFSGVKGLTGRIEIHFLKSCMPGYFWIFPLEDGRANVGLGLVSGDLQKRMKKEKVTLQSLMEHAIKEEPLLAERFKDAKPEGPMTGWRLPFGSHRRQVAGDGWVLVGDAASLVDPFSGEGVGNATLSARLAAIHLTAAIASADVSRPRLQAYQKALWDELGAELSTSYKLQRLGRFEWLLNRIVAKAEKDPHIRQFISASLSDEESKKQLANPLFLLKLLIF